MKGISLFRLDSSLMKIICMLVVILLVYLMTYKWLHGISTMGRFNLFLYVGLETVISLSIVIFIFAKKLFKNKIIKFMVFFLLGWSVDIFYGSIYYYTSFYYHYGFIKTPNFGMYKHWDYYLLLLANLCWLQCLIFGSFFELYCKYINGSQASTNNL